MRREPRRNGDRLTEFLNCEVVIFFVFIFFVEVGLLNCMLTAIQFRAEQGTSVRETPSKEATSLRLTWGSSWIW